MSIFILFISNKNLIFNNFILIFLFYLKNAQRNNCLLFECF